MDGLLTLKGYKFSRKIHLNFQEKTIITGASHLCHDLFNMLEQYFNRKNFSEYYLREDISIIFNGHLLASSEYQVFRIPPLANLAEEIKIVKKNLLGQILAEHFSESTTIFADILQSLQKDVLQKANDLTHEYGIHFVAECTDIFSMAKIFSPQICLATAEEIFPQEQEQFLVKKMLIQLIAQLKSSKKKLLLLELPEYALTDAQYLALCQEISQANIHKIVIYSNHSALVNIFPNIFSYHLAREKQIYGFDDYDYLEKVLLEIDSTVSNQELMIKVLTYIFAANTCQQTNEFTIAIEKFFQKQECT